MFKAVKILNDKPSMIYHKHVVHISLYFHTSLLLWWDVSSFSSYPSLCLDYHNHKLPSNSFKFFLKTISKNILVPIFFQKNIFCVKFLLQKTIFIPFSFGYIHQDIKWICYSPFLYLVVYQVPSNLGLNMFLLHLGNLKEYYIIYYIIILFN